MSAKDQIKQIVDFFNREKYLKNKTDGMAEGLMLGANLADEANERSKDATETTLAVQEKYKEQILAQDLNPNKDPELVDLRNGNQTAGERITKFEQKTEQQFTQKALSVRDFGAIGDAVIVDGVLVSGTDNSEFLRQAFACGRKIIMEEGVYLLQTPKDISNVVADGYGYHFLDIASQTKIETVGDVKIIFDNPTKGVKVPHAMRVWGKKNIKIDGVDFLGAINEGESVKNKRTWGLGFFGVEGLDLVNCTFSTFEGHSLHVNRDSSVTDWIKEGSKNYGPSVEALLATSSKNVTVDNCDFEHSGSNGLAIFGLHIGTINNSRFDVTGATYENAIFTDDASQTTKLEQYAINHDISITNCKTNGTIGIGYTSKAIVSGNTAKHIECRSYDFDQQLLNFGETETSPFLWMNYLERMVLITNNIANTSEIRAGSSVIFKANTLKSRLSGDKLLNLSNNGIDWNGTSYYDSPLLTAADTSRIQTVDNSFIAAHTNVIGIGQRDQTANLYYLSLNNTFVAEGGNFAETENQPSSGRKLSEQYVSESPFEMRKDVYTKQHFKSDVSLNADLSVIEDITQKYNKLFKSIDNGSTSKTFSLVKIETVPVSGKQSSHLSVKMVGNVAMTGNGFSTDFDLMIDFSGATPVLTQAKQAHGGTVDLLFSLGAISAGYVTVDVSIPAYANGFAEINHASRRHKCLKV